MKAASILLSAAFLLPLQDLDKVLEKADALLGEAKAAYEEAREKSSAAQFVEAGFKLEEARIKYLVLQEIGMPDKQKIASDRLRAVNQLGKLIHDGKVAVSGTPAEGPAAKPPEPLPPPPPANPDPAAKPEDASPKPAADIMARVAVPDAGRQKEAEKLVKDLFKDQYAKKAPADRTVLGRTLLEEARKNTSDPAAQWVLCREAQDVAAQAGDVKTALEAADIVARQFDVDGLALRNGVLAAAAKTARTPEDFSTLASALMKLIDDLVAADQYDLADKAAAAALQHARKSNDVPLALRATSRAREVTEAKNRFQAMKKVLETLAKTPDDPPANLEVGQFLCFVKGNWDLGPRFLVKGPDGPLKNLAQKEVAVPTATVEVVALADGWWELAEKEKSPLQKGQMLSRAKVLYEQALNDASGLVRTKIEKRLASDLFAGDASAPVNLLPMVDVVQDAQGGGAWIREGIALVSPSTNPNGINVIRVPYIPPPEYDLKIVALSSGGTGSLDVGLVSPSGQFSSVTDGFSGLSGLHIVDGKGADKNPTTYSMKLFTDTKPHTLLFSVRKAGVTFTFDGKPIYAWKGELSRLSCDYGAYANLKERKTLFLSTLQRYHLLRLELVPVSGQGKRIR